MKVKVANDSITWKQVAAEAQQVRNMIMESIRRKITPVAGVSAQSKKLQGKTLQGLIVSNIHMVYINFQTLTI